MRGIEALLDRHPHQPRGGESHASLKLAFLLILGEPARSGICVPKGAQHGPHGLKRLRRHAYIGFGRQTACDRHRLDPHREETLQHRTNVPGRIAEIGHLPIHNAKVEHTILRRKDQYIVPLHVAVDQTVETPVRAQRVEKGLEFLLLLNERRDGWADAAEPPKSSVAAALQPQYDRHLASEQRLQLLAFEQRAGVRVIKTQPLAQ